MDSAGDRDATTPEPSVEESGSGTDSSRFATDGAEAGRIRPRPAPHPAVESRAEPTVELPVVARTPVAPEQTAGEAEPPAAVAPPAVPPAAAPAEPPHRTRRWILAGLGGLALGGGAGVGAGVLRTRHRRRPQLPRPPAALVDALTAERRLIAEIDASLPAHSDLGRVLTEVRRDHAAHASALQNALRAYRSTPAAPAGGSAAGSAARPAPRDRAALRAAETAAGGTAARRAAALDGADAALLASIAACEATHSELLS